MSGECNFFLTKHKTFLQVEKAKKRSWKEENCKKRKMTSIKTIWGEVELRCIALRQTLVATIKLNFLKLFYHDTVYNLHS
jgi:hypothetical protein